MRCCGRHRRFDCTWYLETRPFAASNCTILTDDADAVHDAIPNGKVFRAVSVGIVKLQDDDAIAAP
jgi:hypothetical protein